MNIKFLSSSVLLSSSTFNLIEGHGYLKSPRSRNFYARQEGVESSISGVPPTEYNPHSINRKQGNQVCGSMRQNYDDYRDSAGNPMPWIPQAVYREGDEIDIEFTLTANHWGHIEIYVCPNGDASTQDCFLNNPATMVQDLKYNGPRDHNFPERGYIGSPNAETFRFKYQLPTGVTGNQVMIQWRYVTANSCLPPGYRNNSELVSRGWVKTQVSDCSLPLNWTGQGVPEQFFNCAEIQINKSDGQIPTPGVQTNKSGGQTPTPGGGSCGNGSTGDGRCASGECCSEYGWCGTSHAHCNKPAPTRTNEGGACGNGSPGNGICSSGKCCSTYGWCRTSPAHCNNPAPILTNGGEGGGGAPCGNGNRGDGRCPSGECCSQWGWCGWSVDHYN